MWPSVLRCHSSYQEVPGSKPKGNYIIFSKIPKNSQGLVTLGTYSSNVKLRQALVDILTYFGVRFHCDSLVFNIFWFRIAQHIVVPFTKLIQFVADLLGYLCKKVICFVGRMMFCLHLVTMRMEGPIYFILKQNWKKYQFRYPFFPLLHITLV